MCSVRLYSHMTALKKRRRKLLQGGNPSAVLRGGNGADDETTRRAVESDGEEDPMVGTRPGSSESRIGPCVGGGSDWKRKDIRDWWVAARASPAASESRSPRWRRCWGGIGRYISIRFEHTHFREKLS